MIHQHLQNRRFRLTIGLWMLAAGYWMSCHIRDGAQTSMREAGESNTPALVTQAGESQEVPGSPKQLFDLDAADLTRIDWLSAVGSGHALVKTEGAWYYAGMEAVDGKGMSAYLAGLVKAKGIPADSAHDVRGLALLEELILHRTAESAPILVSVYGGEATGPTLLYTTSHPAEMFLADSLGLYARIFTDLRRFWPDGQ